MASEDTFGVLARSTVFSALPERALSVLAEMLQVEEFAKGSTVCEYGEPADSVFVVARGQLSVFPRGGALVIRRLGVGDVFGEYAHFSGRSRTAKVKTDEHAVLLSVDSERFRQFLFEFPEAMWVLFRQAVERLLATEADVQRLHGDGR